ncbi:MAG: acyl-CoA dehydrogenase family protein, partial [Saprospiraceae bacterium]
MSVLQNMALVINEEQQMLKSSAKEYLKEKSPIAALRHLRDTKDEKGYDPAVWQQICEMGWTALAIPEAYNGLGFGYVGAGQVMEEMGRTLAASPLFTSAWLSAPLIEKAGSEHQKTELLSAIADGNLLVTVAVDEGKHHRPLQTAMTAKKDGEKYYLNGNKTFVLDGNVADKIVVVARTNGQKGEAKGISLFLVNADATGLTI